MTTEIVRVSLRFTAGEPEQPLHIEGDTTHLELGHHIFVEFHEDKTGLDLVIVRDAP